MKTFSIVATTGSLDGSLEVYLRSLKRQTLGIDHLEFVLVDDGLTDRSRQVVEEWKRRYPESIRSVRATGEGLADARNAGMAAATAEWITFSDSGLPFHRNCFERIDRFLGGNGDQDLVLICTDAPQLGNSSGKVESKYTMYGFSV